LTIISFKIIPKCVRSVKVLENEKQTKDVKENETIKELDK
jgi:hypothetical protein